MDYLVEEVLAHQPEGVQEFLLRSSALARSSAPLCAAIMPNMDEGQAQDMLERLAKANLFYGGRGIFVGVVGYFVYRSMSLRSPASAPTSFLRLAAGLAIVLSIGALLCSATRPER